LSTPNQMQFWERTLTLVQIGILAVGLEPQKSKEELLKALETQLPDMGITSTSLYQERAILFYACDDLAAKGLLRRDAMAGYQTSPTGQMALRRFRGLQESVRKILGNSPIGY